MEALLIIFAEIIFACLAPLISLVGAFAAALLEMLLALLGLTFSMRSGSRRKPASATRRPLVSRKVIHWSAGVMAAIGLLGLLASVVLFQPLLRYVMDTAADKAGMSIEYEAASGALLSGRVALTDVTLKRDSETGLGFELSVKRVEADVDVWSLLSSEPRIELAIVDGVTGFVRPPVPEKGEPRLPRRKRPFQADLVKVSGVDISVQPKEGIPYPLQITNAEVEPFRSRLALFDLLFRSNLQAEIAGQPMLVETRHTDGGGRETRWRFEDVEAEKLKLVVPKAPLTWLSGGQLSAAVDDSWSLSENRIDMNWNVQMNGIAVAAPDGAQTTERALAGTLSKLVALRGGDASFSYRLQLDEHEVKALQAGNLRQFWDVVLSGFIKGRPEAVPIEETSDVTPGRMRRALDRAKGVLRRGGDTESNGDP